MQNHRDVINIQAVKVIRKTVGGGFVRLTGTITTSRGSSLMMAAPATMTMSVTLITALCLLCGSPFDCFIVNKTIIHEQICR